MSVPSVDIVIPTHARKAWLEEALYSALKQDYPGNWGILVFNDCPEQQYSSPDPRIRIINKSERFRTFGEKRQAMVEASSADWVAFLDDDDILMPWHLRRILAATAAGAKTASASHKFWFDGDRGNVCHPSVMDFMCERAHLLASEGFAALDNGDEHALMVNLAKLAPIHEVDVSKAPSYLYIWGNGVHHLSGTGDPFGGLGFRRDAIERLMSGREPSGELVLRPHWRKDYCAMAQKALDEWLASK
jgi:glycosyltransferase involved in cell wall biosynthesis